MLASMKCSICSNEANGFNYTVYEAVRVRFNKVESCTGCRLFFRRTIVQEKKYICTYKNIGACIGKDGKVLRRNCKACRYDVCISRGMRPDVINESVTIAEQISVLPDVGATCSHDPSSSQAIRTNSSPKLIEETMQSLIQQLILQNDAHERMRRSTFLLTPMDQPRMDDFTEGSSRLGMQLTDQDWSEEMPYAYVWSMQKKFWELCDIVYSFEYIKSFKFVSDMNRHDRIVFLKNSSMLCTVLTRAWYSYQRKSEITINPDGIRACMKWKTVDDLNFDTYVISQLYAMKLDIEEFAILKAVIILNPGKVQSRICHYLEVSEISGLSEDARQVIGHIRKAFLSTLMSKCVARRGLVNGPKVYATMLLLSPVITRQRLMRHTELRRLLVSIRGTIYSCPLCEEMLAE